MLRRLAGAEARHGCTAKSRAAWRERLPIVKLQPAHVLDWWGFLGAGGAALDEHYPNAHDASSSSRSPHCSSAAAPRWSRRGGRARRWRSERVEVIAEGDEPAGAAQLLWANMMLHAARDPAAVMARWHRALAVDGFVMFSCLGPDTLKELRALYRRLGWPAPGTEFVDMHDLGDMMVHAGFADPVMDQELLTLTWPDP